MSQHQIAALWITEGGNPSKADEWSAISMAESGGDTQAGNSCCHGIAQINVSAGVGSMKCALSPVCATRLSIKLSKNGRDWTPWEAYTNGAYKQFVGKSGTKGLANIHTGTAQSGCKPASLATIGTGAASGAAAGALFPVPGADLVTAAGGAVVGGVAGYIGGNVIGGCSPVTSPLKGIDSLAAAVESIARLVEDLFTARFWVRFGKGLLGALLIVYALQGMLKSVFGMEIPIGPANAFLKGQIASAAGKGAVE